MTAYQTADNRFLNLLFLGDSDRDFADVAHHIGQAELGADERFATALARQANNETLMAIFDEAFAAKTLDEWKVVLVTAKGAWAPVQTPEEVYDDPQTLANGFLRHVDYPDGGLKVPVPPVLFDEEAGDPPRAPDYGEHTDDILSELGIDAAGISRLRQAGVVG